MTKERRNALARAQYATPTGREKILARTRKYVAANKEKVYDRNEKWRKTESGKTSRRRSMLQTTYGITLEEYALLAARFAGCWICGVTPKTISHAVDHDHKTGLVRGILCHRCNRGLQMFGDKPERFERAAEYLRNNLASEVLGGPRPVPKRKRKKK